MFWRPGELGHHCVYCCVRKVCFRGQGRFGSDHDYFKKRRMRFGGWISWFNEQYVALRKGYVLEVR